MGSIVNNGEGSLSKDTNSDDIIVSLEFGLSLLSLFVHFFADKTPIYAEIRGNYK